MAQDGLIEASADDNAVSRNDESANGYFAAASGLMREGNGSPHEKDVLIRTRKRHGDLQLMVSQVLLGILKQHRGKTRQNENGPASGRALPMSAMPNSAPEQEKDALSPPRLSPALRAAAGYLLAALTCVIGTMFFTDGDGGNARPLSGPWLILFVGASTLFIFVALKRVTEKAGRSAPTIVNDDYRTLFDTDPAPQWLYAVDSGEVLALNAAAAKLYGLTADPFTAISAEALIHPLPPSPQSSMRLTHQTVGGRTLELETHVSSHSFSGRHCHLVTVRDNAGEHLSESLFAEALAKVQPVLYRFDPVRKCYDYISDRGADWLDAPIHALRSPGGWQQFARRVDTKDLDRIRIAIGDALKTPGDEPVEISVAYQLKSRTGPRWICDAMTLLRHPDGSLRAIVGAASDQTEEQCAAGKRTDQEARYRALVENAPVGIFHFTAELLVSYCNSRLADILKSSPEQLAGMDLHSLGDEAILSVLHGALQGQRGAYDGPFVSPLSTDMQILSIRVAPEFDAAGKVFGGVGIIEDRTAFLEAEEQLRDTRERYVLAQRGTNEGLWDWDPKTRDLYLSARLLSLLGLHSDTLRTTGDEWLKLIHPDDRQRYRTDFVAHLRGETEHFESEYRIADKDGKFHWVLARGLAHRNQQGRAVRIVGSIGDITARKLAEEQLKSERDFSRGLIDSLPAPFFLFDQNGRLLLWNRFVSELTGLADGALLRADAQSLVIPEHEALMAHRIETALISGEASAEVMLRRNDGEPVPFLVVGRRVTLDGKPHIVGVGTDLTERKFAERAIKRLNTELERRVAERTSQLSAALSELESFSYSVSHDLRAPLRAIEGYSAILGSDYGDKLDDEAKELLRRVRAAVHRMGQLIDDLLTLSRVSRKELERRPVDLSQLAQVICEELHQQEPDRDVQIRIAPRLQVEGDPSLMRTVLENLLGNAWKFTGRVEHPTIEFNVARHGETDAFVIRDNGAGFDMRYRENLFRPFQRLHSDREFPGTGIGLATVARIVRRHGGEVWAEGDVGKGASLYFSIGQPPTLQNTA